LLYGALAGAQQSPVDAENDVIAPDFEPVPLEHIENVQVSSGELSNRGRSFASGFSQSIEIAGAQSIQLHFVNTNLGERSFVTITSDEDGAQQRLNSATLEQWGNSSAIFNGNKVKIEVQIAPGESGISIEIQQVTVGDAPGVGGEQVGGGQPQLCNSDPRTAASHRAVGRLRPSRCTAWMVSNGALLTAGHCAQMMMQSTSIEFEVPASGPNGALKSPTIDNQYPIVPAVVWANPPQDDAGDDWAVFGVYPNSVTGLLPAQKQGAFFRLTDRVVQSEMLDVAGYGEDKDPIGSDGYFNAANQTLQSDDGPLVYENEQGASDVYLKYQVYTESGSSGSPVVALAVNLGIGIHTNGGESCSGNFGTGFKNDSLEQALQTFPGPNVVYVDNGHPEPMEDGTIFRPFDSVIEGVAALSAGGILSIVTGEYTEAPPSGGGLVIDKAMTLSAPVGPVAINLNANGGWNVGAPRAPLGRAMRAAR
jgi:hypothetical protein